MDLETIMKRKRSDSSDADDGTPLLKTLKQEAFDNTIGSLLKRPASPSNGSLEDERPLKSLKKEQEASDGFDIGGVRVTSIQKIAIDANGQQIYPIPSHESSGGGRMQYGLPTPDPSPMPKDVNPFEKRATDSTFPASLEGISNFAFKGEMQLFGLIPSKIYIYEHTSSVLHPYNEVVEIAPNCPLSLGMLMPSLKDSEWNVIALENPILGFQEEVVLDGSLSRLNGLYFETDLTFHGALQPVSDFLRDFFKQEKPAIRFSSWLGSDRSYAKPLYPPSFTLRGSLDHVSVNVLDILTFRQIGIELNGRQTYNLAREASSWEFDYGFFGKLDLNVPGSVVPLQVDYKLSQVLEAWVLRLRLKNDEWNDIFGIKDLKLSEVKLQARLDTGRRTANLSVGIEAALELRKTTFGVRGYYSKDFYSIEAYLGDLTLHDIGELFKELVGMDLENFSHDVALQSMTLHISSEGLELKGQVTVNGHTSTSGGLRLSRDGISVQGSIGDIEFEHVLIKEAALDVFIASKLETQCAQASKVDIFGHVNIEGVELKAALHTERAADGEYHWTIYGEVEGDVTTSKIVPDLKDTFLDISLNRLALIASNHEAPLGSYKGINYPVAKGFQFCASIDRIPELEQLMRGSVKGMIFRAAITDGKFALSIILPTERTITFGDNVYTGPLMIEVEKQGVEFNLVLKALLNVNVDTQPDPLKFSLGLKASYSGASAYAQMVTDWVNPCNIGKQVTVRGCALEFGIVYATFFTTGMPGAIGMGGQIMIGNKEAKLAMKLSQNPKEQILAAAVKDLGVVDLVKFASQICEYDFPEPDDFLHFNDVQLYLSTGASIGETYYPPGASLKGDMTIFGKRAKFDCTLGTMIKIMATIQHFDLGPLQVKGATGEDPIVDIELSSTTQKVLIDGAVDLWALSAALHLEAEVYPKPSFDFWVDVSLSDWVKFKLNAKLIGDIDFTDLKSLANADFAVYGLMEQHVLDNIIEMLDKQIKSMHENADFKQAKQRLTDRENEFNAFVQAAQSRLDDARQMWEAKQEALTEELDRAKSEAQTHLQKLQDNVDAADKAFVNAIAAARANLEEARHNEAVSIHLAETDLQRAQLESDETVRSAQNDLHRKRDTFEILFGSARSDLIQAKGDVDAAVLANEAISKQVEDLDCRIADAPLLEMPVLVADKAIKVAEQTAGGVALEAVRAILGAAELVIQGAEFIAAETAIAADERALETLLQSQKVALETARNTFDGVKATHEQLVSRAVEALEYTEGTSSEQQLCTQSKTLLTEGEATARSMVSPAEQAYDNRHHCTEYLDMIAAEKALATAQSNTVEVELARQACELVKQDSSSFADDILEVGLNIGKWIDSAVAELINITKIEFSGSISSLVADGPPLNVNIEGKLLGQDIDIHLEWQPHFNLAKFLKAIFSELWEMIKSAAGKFLKALGAEIVEVVGDIAELVGDAAEVIGEGLEKAGEAIDDAVSDLGHAADDVASAFGDAASDVGHAVEDVANDIGDAFSDAGSAINDAVSDVGHAVDDVVDNVGEAFNDAGHTVENVANDVGNAISNFFDW